VKAREDYPTVKTIMKSLMVATPGIGASQV